MEKVRTIFVKCGTGIDEHLRIAFVYRGYYAIKGQGAAYHTPNIVRNKCRLSNIYDDDVFHLAHNKFDDEKFFKETIDEHIDYVIRAHGSLENYFALNS